MQKLHPEDFRKTSLTLSMYALTFAFGIASRPSPATNVTASAPVTVAEPLPPTPGMTVDHNACVVTVVGYDSFGEGMLRYDFRNKTISYKGNDKGNDGHMAEKPFDEQNTEAKSLVIARRKFLRATCPKL